CAEPDESGSAAGGGGFGPVEPDRAKGPVVRLGAFAGSSGSACGCRGETGRPHEAVARAGGDSCGTGWKEAAGIGHIALAVPLRGVSDHGLCAGSGEEESGPPDRGADPRAGGKKLAYESAAQSSF